MVTSWLFQTAEDKAREAKKRFDAGAQEIIGRARGVADSVHLPSLPEVSLPQLPDMSSVPETFMTGLGVAGGVDRKSVV